ncbi:MAG: DEAD/DEAH box helicase family protein [Bacteroidaceae bacterium]|nr:DEAD/DEAH box helicase family protein [Bacteroidaceae bacterium]
MLQEIIQLHDEAVTALVDKIAKKDVITFKSPTGSGKTYMMADFMDRILSVRNDVVFLVSSLSKSELAKQNYDKFCEYKDQGEFPNLNPYLISSEVSGEEGVFVPIDYNVYVLPRDLYKKGGRLMQGAMDNFLQTITRNLFGNGLDKKVYLIKDECHQATNNLDTISTDFFSKTINISATPKLSRGQVPDVEVTEEAAINAKLIKTVEWNEEDSDVAEAIEKFEEIKKDYRNLLGVNPCLIIQISNKDKANDDLAKIYDVLDKPEHKDLKWMLIVDKDKDCNTNDVFKAKKMPVARWKDYAKEKGSTIDIIIFKMVITEGWDIPRACMLYQMRPTQSDQLDEQVVGRVRRNPRLLDFERLSPEAQELALKAWVWGVKKKDQQRTFVARLFEEPSDITDNIRIKTTKLKLLIKKPGFDIREFMDGCSNNNRYSDIFSLYRKFKKTEPEVQAMGYEYAETPCQWLKFAENIDSVVKENNKYVCDYSVSMELTKDEVGKVREVSFPVESMYTDNGNYENIADWVWKRKENSQRFAFDSEAEQEWACILKDLAKEDTLEPLQQRVGKRVVVGKRNPNAGQYKTDGSIEDDKLNPSNKYLWGKNFISNSEIKFEYCLGGIHSSYPDFVMEDCFGRIHLFEVKSVNVANATPAAFDSEEYKMKMNELIRCYKQASILTGHIFYLPVMKDDNWVITQLLSGEEKTLTYDQFEEFMKRKPSSQNTNQPSSNRIIPYKPIDEEYEYGKFVAEE